jgi:hypothetical protein
VQLCFLPREMHGPCNACELALRCPAAGRTQKAGRAAAGIGSVAQITPYLQYCTSTPYGVRPSSSSPAISEKSYYLGDRSEGHGGNREARM